MGARTGSTWSCCAREPRVHPWVRDCRIGRGASSQRRRYMKSSARESALEHRMTQGHHMPGHHTRWGRRRGVPLGQKPWTHSSRNLGTASSASGGTRWNGTGVESVSEALRSLMTLVNPTRKGHRMNWRTIRDDSCQIGQIPPRLGRENENGNDHIPPRFWLGCDRRLWMRWLQLPRRPPRERSDPLNDSKTGVNATLLPRQDQ